jgi:glycosyltransferase involved in cell wall biosynthesis
VEAGFEVHLVAPHTTTETVQGVVVHGVEESKGRLGRFFGTAWRVYKATVMTGASVVHLHDPELIPIGFLLRLRGKKVVYDAHEDTAMVVLSKEWIPPILRRLASLFIRTLNILAGCTFSGIVAATPHIADAFPSQKTICVRNYPKLEEFNTGTELPKPDPDPLFVYVGGITEVRGAKEMVRALDLASVPCNGARLALAGDVSDSLRAVLENTPGWNRVEYLGWQSRQEIVELLARATAGLVVLHPTPNHLESLPIKMFEYMAAGLPVIASDFPLWRRIVEDAQCGLLVDPFDTQAIAQAMEWIMEHPIEARRMGENGKRAVLATFNWETERRYLIEFYDTIEAR